MVEEYEAKKKPLVDQMNDIIGKVTTKQATLEQMESNVIDTGEAFNDLIYDLWKKLLTIEMQLYERCEVTFDEKLNF